MLDLVSIVARRGWSARFLGHPVFRTAREVTGHAGSNHPGCRLALFRVTVAEAGGAAPWVVS